MKEVPRSGEILALSQALRKKCRATAKFWSYSGLFCDKCRVAAKFWSYRGLWAMFLDSFRQDLRKSRKNVLKVGTSRNFWSKGGHFPKSRKNDSNVGKSRKSRTPLTACTDYICSWWWLVMHGIPTSSGNPSSKNLKKTSTGSRSWDTGWVKNVLK